MPQRTINLTDEQDAVLIGMAERLHRTPEQVIETQMTLTLKVSDANVRRHSTEAKPNAADPDTGKP